jgi:hypothetical protein
MANAARAGSGVAEVFGPHAAEYRHRGEYRRGEADYPHRLKTASGLQSGLSALASTKKAARGDCGAPDALLIRRRFAEETIFLAKCWGVAKR